MTEPPRLSARASVHNYASSVVGNYALLALSLATSVYLTRSLGAEDFGRLTLILTVVQTGAVLGGFWTHNALLRHGAESVARAGTLRPVFWARILTMLPLLAVLLGGAWLLRDRLDAFYRVAEVGFGTVVLFAGALLAAQGFHLALQARGRAGTVAALQAGERAVLLLGLVLLAPWGAPSLGLVVALSIGAAVAVSAASAALLPVADFLPVGTDAATVRRFVGFSWPIVIAVVGSYLSSNWFDVVILRSALGPRGVGQYALAYQVMGAMQQVPAVSFAVIVPLLVTSWLGDRERPVRVYLERVVPHAVFAMVAALCVGVLVGPPIVTVVFGSEFAESARALPVLLLAVGAYAVFIAYFPILNLHERSLRIVAATLAAAAVHVTTALLLVPVAGVLGAAWATVLSHATGAVVVAYLARRDYAVPLGRVFFLVVPLAALVVVAALRPRWPVLLVAGGLAAALLAAAGRALDLASPADRALLASLDLPLVRRFLPTPAREGVA